MLAWRLARKILEKISELQCAYGGGGGVHHSSEPSDLVPWHLPVYLQCALGAKEAELRDQEFGDTLSDDALPLLVGKEIQPLLRGAEGL